MKMSARSAMVYQNIGFFLTAQFPPSRTEAGPMEYPGDYLDSNIVASIYLHHILFPSSSPEGTQASLGCLKLRLKYFSSPCLYNLANFSVLCCRHAV